MTERTKLRSMSVTSNFAFTLNATNMSSISTTDDAQDKENLAIRQAQFFKFTTSNFLNEHYNIVIQCWASAVNETAIPRILERLNLSARQLKDKDKLEDLRRLLLNRLFQHGKLDLIFKRAHNYLDKYIFYIPPIVSTDEDNTKLMEVQQEDEDQIWREIAELEQEILMLRIQIKYVKSENEKAALCVQFLEQLKAEEEEETEDANVDGTYESQQSEE